MENNRRYTTMVFPQGFKGNTLFLNIVLIPRNQDPFDQNTGLTGNELATPFADLVPAFELRVVKGLDEWPISNPINEVNAPGKITVTATESVNKKALLQSIAADFGAKINPDPNKNKAETEEITLNKYLPESYRKSFNFTTPRVKNAKTDDSYHCAIRKERKRDPDWKTQDDLSWGQVFAHILRQPMLAKACGMIYSAEVDVMEHEDWYKKGCYIYADLVNEDYKQIQENLFYDDGGQFVKRYAARIPKLLQGTDRPVFAPLLIPVLDKKAADVVDPEPSDAPWDQVFSEINEYNDGFAKIVHASQPVSSNLLSEQQDGAHPVNDAGIRLAWDDEQILIWYMRQLTNNPDTGKRIDVPMGVFGYKIDVKKQDAPKWNSLNLVKCNQVFSVGDVSLGNKAGATLELPYQVYPTQPDNDKTGPYWLPMYYTGWIGKSLVLKDTDAIQIYRNNEALNPANESKNVSAVAQFEEVAVEAELFYGSSYEFRVRMMDISGGGPALESELLNNAACPSAKWFFKRYIAPGPCIIEKPEGIRQAKTTHFNETLIDDKSVFDANPVLKIKRPVLTYPAVVFTNKYQLKNLDPIELLIQSAAVNEETIIPAIPDPDVMEVEIKVEVETLRLDNLLSDSGKENYITLYRTTRSFKEDFYEEMTVPITFRDVKSLNLGNQEDPFNDLELNNLAINSMAEIPLPTARNIRVTVRALCTEIDNYYGFKNPGNPDLDSRYGTTTQFLFYKESKTEEDIFLPKQNVAPLKGIYLQPDPQHLIRQRDNRLFLHVEKTETIPDIVQRLAQQLGVTARGMTLSAKKGERVVFGCSNRIQHHLAPDQSSITLGTKGDLCNHWLGCIVYRINRDWSWDALENVSFSISRNKKFKHDEASEMETVKVGDIELKHYASFESLSPNDFGNVNREYTTLIFIDAIEPKSALLAEDGQPRFPDELEVDYSITPHFKADHGSEQELKTELLSLPTTIIPAQTPKITSVGIAFSRYRKNEKYSATEPRQRYLWVELEEPVKDPNDTLFCRVLHYGVDQLLSNNAHLPDETIEDAPLPIDPEYVRSITPNQTDDMAGLGAMQAMEKANGDDDIHYLLPLPPGLHAESPELFGFFTYEFRVGHGHWSNLPEGKDNLWSTANGRFGRPLRITGMQHPAPTLLCTVDRDQDSIKVNAPYAKAVFDGKDITADPPRTQLHCVLFAQVKQADGADFRNILLGEKQMELYEVPEVPEDKKQSSPWDKIYQYQDEILQTIPSIHEAQIAGNILTNLSTFDQVADLKLDRMTQEKISRLMAQRKMGIHANPDPETSRKMIDAFADYRNKVLKPAPPKAKAFTNASLLAGAKLAIYKDQIKTGGCVWENLEISGLLDNYGLPRDSSLSVVVVEVFGNITSVFDFMSITGREMSLSGRTSENYASAIQDRKERSRQALGDQLGHYRALRTSPLTEIPFVCCPTCD